MASYSPPSPTPFTPLAITPGIGAPSSSTPLPFTYLGIHSSKKQAAAEARRHQKALDQLQRRIIFTIAVMGLAVFVAMVLFELNTSQPSECQARSSSAHAVYLHSLPKDKDDGFLGAEAEIFALKWCAKISQHSSILSCKSVTTHRVNQELNRSRQALWFTDTPHPQTLKALNFTLLLGNEFIPGGTGKNFVEMRSYTTISNGRSIHAHESELELESEGGSLSKKEKDEITCFRLKAREAMISNSDVAHKYGRIDSTTRMWSNINKLNDLSNTTRAETPELAPQSQLVAGGAKVVVQAVQLWRPLSRKGIPPTSELATVGDLLETFPRFPEKEFHARRHSTSTPLVRRGPVTLFRSTVASIFAPWGKVAELDLEQWHEGEPETAACKTHTDCRVFLVLRTGQIAPNYASNNEVVMVALTDNLGSSLASEHWSIDTIPADPVWMWNMNIEDKKKKAH